MANIYFGKAFTIPYFYRVDAAPSSDSPSIYLFEDNPTLANAADGTGASQTVSSWTDSDKENAKDISFSAVSDPDSTSKTKTRDYFIAVNYKPDSGGDTITDVKEIFIQRPTGSFSEIGVSINDVIGLEDTVGVRLKAAKIEEKIEIATRDIKSALRKRGATFDNVADREDLHLALLYLSTAYCYLSLFKEIGSEAHEKHGIYKDMYDSQMKGLKLNYDADSDGKRDSKVGTSLGHMVLIK